MGQEQFDVIICGSGPIGAATAHFLLEANPDLKLAVITQDPTDDHSATYTQAGGCLRWFWDEPIKREMTEATAEFVRRLAKEGVNLSLIEDHYLFMYRGVYAPALNFSGRKLVEYLVARAEAKGATVMRGAKVLAVKNEAETATVETSVGAFKAGKVLLALGPANGQFLDNYQVELEKRQLFVLDVPVNETNNHYPHVILPLGEGYVYVFLKQTPQGLRFVVGQEDVVETNDEAAAEDYWQSLLDAGLGEAMPFLRKAKVEQIWWGFDAAGKELQVKEQGHVLAANCGSAARACAWIGRELAGRLAS